MVYLYQYSLATSGNPVTNTTYWVKLVEGFSFDGVYDNATQYEVGDTVTHGGKVYVANAATVGTHHLTQIGRFSQMVFNGKMSTTTPLATNEMMSSNMAHHSTLQYKTQQVISPATQLFGRNL